MSNIRKSENPKIRNEDMDLSFFLVAATAVFQTSQKHE